MQCSQLACALIGGTTVLGFRRAGEHRHREGPEFAVLNLAFTRQGLAKRPRRG
jgi:hypothetical protein